MLTLTLNKADMIFAFDSDDVGMAIYLDSTTGEIHHIEDSTFQELEDLLTDEESLDACLATLDQQALAPYDGDNLKLAVQIEWDDRNRFRQIRNDDPYRAYNDMRDFIDTIEDTRLYERLARAIHGRGAFGRFKKIIYQREPLRVAWLAFKEARLFERVQDWLASEEIVADWL
jgi:Uncharacterised protein family (UPF0158)